MPEVPPLLFPEPQRAHWSGAAVSLGRAGAAESETLPIVLPQDAAPLEQEAAQLIANRLVALGLPRPALSSGVPVEQPAIRLGAGALALPGMAELLDGVPDRPEGYALRIALGTIALVGRTPEGTYSAAQTLVQLLQRQDENVLLPAGEVQDWPDLRYRGLYVESKWGPDLMTLEDWCRLIDEMAALKFNSLGIGVYGCWVVQYDGRRTEFLMVPFPEHPELKTPKVIRWYSPASGTWQSLDYLPRMFTEDFLGQIVAYGRRRNVRVRPHFNGPGHNTLIPSVYPEVSAKTAEGTPTGYGYCLTSEATYRLLFSLYDSLIERHLRPHGGTWWHMAMDEVNPYVGIDPRDETRAVSPWCECPQCRGRDRAELLVDFAVRSIEHLVGRGITDITLWNDALEKLGALERFAERLRQRGLLQHVVVQWWRYSEPPLEPRPETGVRAWVTPMAGYWSNLFHHSYLTNIYSMLAGGYDRGAEGADAYCIYDPAYHRNYACLAEYAWNQTSTGDLFQFKSKYARWLVPPDEQSSRGGVRTRFGPGVELFDRLDHIFDSSYEPLGTLLDSLLYYWYTYPAARAAGLRYPRDVLAGLAGLRGAPRAWPAIERAHGFAETARARIQDALARTESDDAKRRVLQEYNAECTKLIEVVNGYAAALSAVSAYRRAQQGWKENRAEAQAALQSAATSLDKAAAAVREALASLERTKAPFLLPHTLRDLSELYAYFAALAAAAKQLLEQLPDTLPDFFTLG